jgi:transposase
VREGRSRGGHRFAAWVEALLRRKPPKLVAVALANKLARIAWKLMVTGEAYAARPVRAAMSAA